LIAGDPAAILDASRRYVSRSKSASSRGGRAHAAAAIGWEGETADAFRMAAGVLRARADDEAALFHECASALDEFAGVLSWAQEQADTAIHDWTSAEGLTSTARLAHERTVAAATKGTFAGIPIVIVPPFVDPGAPGRANATAILADARAAVEQAEAQTIRVLARSAAAAPTQSLLRSGPALTAASTVRPGTTAIPVPTPSSTIPQIVAWLTTGSYTIGELIVSCGVGSVIAALSFVVIGGVGSGSTAGEPLSAARNRRLAAAEARMRAQTRNPDGSLRSVAGQTPVGHTGLLAEEGPTTADEVKEILKESTKRGKSKPHREVDTPEELAEVYDKLVKGGEPIESPDRYGGDTVRLPDGTEIGRRDGSSSGGPTIDVRYPGRSTNVKVHLPKGWGK